MIAAHGAVCAHCGRTATAYLNLAHLDHDQRSPRTALLCVGCHNTHDAAYRLAMARRDRARRYGQLWLLPELEYAPFPAWRMPPRVRNVDAEAQIELF
jgi:hypothetical protein